MAETLAKTCPQCGVVLTPRLGELECRSCGYVVPPDAARDGPGTGGALAPLLASGAGHAQSGAGGSDDAGHEHRINVFFMIFVLFMIFSIIAAAIGFPAVAKLDLINHRTPMHPAGTGLLMIFIIVFYAILAAITYWALHCRQLWAKWGCLALTIVFLIGSIGNWTSSFFTWVLIDAPGQSLPGVLRFILAISVLGHLCLELWFISLLYHDTKRQA